jgi:hypothetical protein
VRLLSLFFGLQFFFCFSIRKGTDELRIQLSKIIVPIYCLAVDQSNDDRRQKLVKVQILKKNWIRSFYEIDYKIFLHILSHTVTRSLGKKQLFQW